MTSDIFNVIQAGQAVIVAWTNRYMITNLSGVPSINVVIMGYGIYKYSLDNEPRQSSNVFDNGSVGILYNNYLGYWRRYEL